MQLALDFEKIEEYERFVVLSFEEEELEVSELVKFVLHFCAFRDAGNLLCVVCSLERRSRKSRRMNERAK